MALLRRGCGQQAMEFPLSRESRSPHHYPADVRIEKVDQSPAEVTWSPSARTGP